MPHTLKVEARPRRHQISSPSTTSGIHKNHEKRSKKAVKHAKAAARHKANQELNRLLGNLTLDSPAEHPQFRVVRKRQLSPAEKVFNITELAEKILSNLNEKDLFRSRGICRDVKEAVMGSSVLREKLFLDCRDRAKTVWHFYLDSLFSDVWASKSSEQDSENDETDEEPTIDMTVRKLNPLIFSGGIAPERKCPCLSCQIRRVRNPLIFDQIQLEGLEAERIHRRWAAHDRFEFRFSSFAGMPAIFDDMYITLPPTRRIEFVCYPTTRPRIGMPLKSSEAWEVFKPVSVPDGIKVKHIRAKMHDCGIGGFVFHKSAQTAGEATLYEWNPIRIVENKDVEDDGHGEWNEWVMLPTDEEFEAMEAGRIECICRNQDDESDESDEYDEFE